MDAVSCRNQLGNSIVSWPARRKDTVESCIPLDSKADEMR